MMAAIFLRTRAQVLQAVSAYLHQSEIYFTAADFCDVCLSNRHTL